jgi:catechol 2,3-dioxygenase-like lactoylglutathione lyase family enzyme
VEGRETAVYAYEHRQYVEQTMLNAPNVKQAVPFFSVANMDASLRFYVDGLGFAMTKKWVYDGTVRWCWLQLGDAALMLQDRRMDNGQTLKLEGKVGVGISICFICQDALAIYRAAKERGLQPSRPFVGNGTWVTSLSDPDGYRIDFESDTDAPEESTYGEADPGETGPCG